MAGDRNRCSVRCGRGDSGDTPFLRPPPVRLLWLLPKAAPALLRHLVAYVDLVSVDLARAQREFMAELVISAITAICTLFAALMGCVAVVAYTWDTPYRMTAIAWMG